MENLINDDLEKSESDSDSNDEKNLNRILIAIKPNSVC